MKMVFCALLHYLLVAGMKCWRSHVCCMAINNALIVVDVSYAAYARAHVQVQSSGDDVW